jgi:hypothetical protein
MMFGGVGIGIGVGVVVALVNVKVALGVRWSMSRGSCKCRPGLLGRETTLEPRFCQMDGVNKIVDVALPALETPPSALK